MNDPIRDRHIVVGIGEILWDIFPEGKRLGGAPANFALHAQALGSQAKIVSAIGHDMPGLDIFQQLSGRQIDTEYILMNKYPTGRVDVKISGNGHPEYVIHENAAWDYIPFSSQTKELAQISDAVCFGSLAQRNPTSRRSIQEFLKNTRKDCLRVFDINLRQNYFSREIIEESLQAAAILKLNDEELEVLRNFFDLPESTEAALRTLLSRYQLDFIAFTKGSAGSIMLDQKSVYCCDGIPVTVKDTVGAGDSFAAAMVTGKLYGLPLEKINRLAGSVAAYVCSQSGATPTLPPFLAAELKQGTPFREMSEVSPVPEITKSDLRKANPPDFKI